MTVDVFSEAFHRLTEVHEPEPAVTRRRKALDALARIADQITKEQQEGQG